MTKQHKNKLDEAVKITAKGNVKLTVPGLVVGLFSDAVFTNVAYLDECCRLVPLSVGTCLTYAERAFLLGLYRKYFEHRNLPPEDYTIQVTISEACLLVGIMGMPFYDQVLLIALREKLQQKLS